MQTASDAFVQYYTAHRERLLGFLAYRVGDAALAEDLLQDSLVKALGRAPGFDDEASLARWFYRVLRNAVTDTYRRRAAHARTLDAFARTLDAEPDEAEAAQVCRCFEPLLPTLKPEYAELIAALDLAREPREAVAGRLGITADNLKVRHHRARRQLRERLEAACRTCAAHGCLDCSCTR